MASIIVFEGLAVVNTILKEKGRNLQENGIDD